MRKPYRYAVAAALTLPLLLSGCSLVFTTRKLPIPKLPSMEQTVAPEALVAQLNQRWDVLSSLTANVDIQASVLKTKEGVAKDYTSISGIILLRKPEMLRVYGRVPVIGNRMFDMVSDGKDFTLWVPHFNKAYNGSNTLKKKSASLIENMRPGFFFDAMAVRGLGPDDLYSVVADSETVEDKARKHLYSVPEYILSISRRKPGSNQLTPVRVITFNRDDLMPSQQDIYDSDGNLETQVYYAFYQDFGAGKYPSWVKIVRPLEDVQVVLTVDKVIENQTLKDDQFVLKLSEGTQIQSLE
jgi:outer membrane lipoprotein-sorting protein